MVFFSLFFREAGSPVARQVVHAGVHRFFFSFMSSPFPTQHGGDEMEGGVVRGTVRTVNSYESGSVLLEEEGVLVGWGFWSETVRC